MQNDWSDQFKNKLAQALIDSSGDSSGLVNKYNPAWYNGYQANSVGQLGFLSNMGDTLGSQLSSAVTQSSSPPGSSSGSGGGGFSGGGGGGGGGW